MHKISRYWNLLRAVLLASLFLCTPLAFGATPDPFPVVADPLPCDDADVCGVTGCSGPGCAVQGASPFAVPLAYSLRSTGGGHTHQCPRCTYVWDHSEDGGAHVCPRCGSRQNVVSNLPATRLTAGGVQRASYTAAPPSLWEPVAAPVVGGCSAGCAGLTSGGGFSASSSVSVGSSFSTAREPVLRVRGGPGIVRSVFGGRGLFGGCGN